MGEPAERAQAEVLPVGPGVDQVQVPGFVNRVGRRDGRLAGDSEEHEPPVFQDHPIGEFLLPALVGSQSLREALTARCGIEGEALHLVP